jgi:hypothetical protein
MKWLLKYSLVLVSLCACTSEVENFGELPCEFKDFSDYYQDPSELNGLSNQYILIGVEEGVDKSRINEFIKSKEYLDPEYDTKINSSKNYNYKYLDLAIKLKAPSSCNQITWIMNDLKQSPIISYTHYTVNSENCTNLVGEPIGNSCVDSYSNILYLKLKDLSDSIELKNIASETNTIIKGQDNFMPLWFTIYVNKDASQELFALREYFKESGLFEHVDPDIIKLQVD